MRPIIAGAIVLATTGCASIVNETTHPLKLETQTDQGQAIGSAECRLTNDDGSTLARSGETSPVRRSSKRLDIVCRHPDNPDAVARAVPQANAGMAGNILIGGGIGAIIDHNKGTASTCPTWVQLVFGKTLVFDRNDELAGRAVRSTEPTAVPTTTAKK